MERIRVQRPGMVAEERPEEGTGPASGGSKGQAKRRKEAPSRFVLVFPEVRAVLTCGFLPRHQRPGGDELSPLPLTLFKCKGSIFGEAGSSTGS